MHIDDTLLLQLYGSIEHEARWLGVLDTLRERLGVESAVAQVLSSARPCLQQVWTARDSVSLRHAKIHDSWANSSANPRFRRPSPPRRSDVAIGSDFRSLDHSAAEQAQMRDGLAGCGLGPAFWIGFGLGEYSHFSLVFHRKVGDDRDIAPAEADLLRHLQPHLEQAVRLWLHTSESAARIKALETAIQATDLAMIACDRGLRIAWSNPLANELLATSPHLADKNGALVAGSVAETAALRGLVAQANVGEPALLALGMAGDDPLHLRAVAGANQAGIGTAASDEVLLILSAPERRSRLAPSCLRQLYRLTGAEALLAAALADGETLAGYAARRGITEGTVRIQLKQLFGKTGTSRQADLVRLLLQSPVRRGTPARPAGVASLSHAI